VQARLRVMLLYPAFVLAAALVYALWRPIVGGAEGDGHAFSNALLLMIALTTLPGYGLGVVVLAPRLRALDVRVCAAVALLSAALTPTLTLGAFAIVGQIYVRHQGLADTLIVAGPLFSGTVAVPVGYFILGHAITVRRRAPAA
jgi:predicted anti-sigma-YlaC factor YlaD